VFFFFFFDKKIIFFINLKNTPLLLKQALLSGS